MASGGKEFFRERYERLGGKIVDLKLQQVIRVNTLRISAKDLIARLAALGVELERIPFTRNGYAVKKSRFSLGAITEFLLGYYYVQEAAAQLPVDVLDPKAGDVVLDCCAAPGGKTTQLAAAMDNKGTIISYELKEHRMPSLLMNLERCGVQNAVVFQGDVSLAKGLGQKFTKILLDAPCAGNFLSEQGWYDKRTLDGIERSSQIQKRILKNAVDCLAEGGELVYSTCSLEPEENELNMQWAIENLPVRLEKVSCKIGDPGLTQVFGQSLDQSIALTRRFWPHKTGTQGFYIAKLVRV
ncbi:RsmB/NOP family class I SAM-dependent RNA methyltransferase [Candidatus Woesearchaeota archaeon]|nr:MAG: RsmB/NOP family class I SAM-dependent RNA methyltransferase [Candidatus Woesearchaeota archaeon]